MTHILPMAAYLSVFLAVFYKPAEAIRMAGEAGNKGWRFFCLFGIPLIMTGALGRMWIVGSGSALSLASLLLFLINLASYALAILLGSLLVAKLSRPFRSDSDRMRTMNLMVVAFSPFFVSQVVIALLPGLTPIGFAALGYTVFLYGRGLQPLLQTPPEKVAGLTLVSFFILLGIAWVVNIILSGLLIFAL